MNDSNIVNADSYNLSAICDPSHTTADLQKSQIVIDTISDGIAIVDSSGIIQLFNPAAEQLTGWDSDSAVNLDYRSIFEITNSAGRDLEPASNPILQAYATKQPTSSDSIFLTTASKKHIQISIKVTPIINKNKQSDHATHSIDGLVIVFRDITREKAEQNAQTDFISTASHEMRTPVATIEGYLGIILNPNICKIDDRARDYALKSHHAIRHLGQLFQDLLDVTKADDNRLNLHPVLVDVSVAVTKTVESFTAKAFDKGLSIAIDHGPSSYVKLSEQVLNPLSIIYVDIDRLEEVLSNMIENAIKYTKKGGVTVRIINTGDRVRIEVSDTGIGIPAEDVPHLFQKFYRVDNSQTREIGGTGLGLYLIKKLTNSMGGTIGVDSNYGEGSTFWVEFDNLSYAQAISKAREIKLRQLNQKDQ